MKWRIDVSVRLTEDVTPNVADRLFPIVLTVWNGKKIWRHYRSVSD